VDQCLVEFKAVLQTIKAGRQAMLNPGKVQITRPLSFTDRNISSLLHQASACRHGSCAQICYGFLKYQFIQLVDHGSFIASL